MKNHLLLLLFFIFLGSLYNVNCVTDWEKVKSDFGIVTTNVKQATDSWQSAMDLFQTASSFFGPIGSAVGFATTLMGIGEPGPEEVILEQLKVLQKALMTEFKRLGEKMELGFDKVIYHIDKTDYRENIVDGIRSAWDKLLILTNNPNNTDALRKFKVACDDYKPEEILLKMYDRLTIEPSILTSLITASVYDWEAFQDFSSSVVQQMMQLENLFVYCEILTNNFTNINQSSSTQSFYQRPPEIVQAIKNAENRMKAEYLSISSPVIIHDCIDRLGPSNEGLACINNTLKARHPWSKAFLTYCECFKLLKRSESIPPCDYIEKYKGDGYVISEGGCNSVYKCKSSGSIWCLVSEQTS